MNSISAYHAIHNFCVVDMSNFYLDVLKDRLYVEKADSQNRRAAQTAMYHDSGWHDPLGFADSGLYLG